MSQRSEGEQLVVNRKTGERLNEGNGVKGVITGWCGVRVISVKCKPGTLRYFIFFGLSDSLLKRLRLCPKTL